MLQISTSGTLGRERKGREDRRRKSSRREEEDRFKTISNLQKVSVFLIHILNSVLGAITEKYDKAIILRRITKP